MLDDSGFENDIATIRPDGSTCGRWPPRPGTRRLRTGPLMEADRLPLEHRDAHQWDVYVMRRDGGSPPTRLTTTEGYNPVWSPDGRKIAFNNNELFTMRADGSRLRTVLSEFLDAHHPDWQPAPQACARRGRRLDQRRRCAASAWPAA